MNSTLELPTTFAVSFTNLTLDQVTDVVTALMTAGEDHNNHGCQ